MVDPSFGTQSREPSDSGGWRRAPCVTKARSADEFPAGAPKTTHEGVRDPPSFRRSSFGTQLSAKLQLPERVQRVGPTHGHAGAFKTWALGSCSPTLLPPQVPYATASELRNEIESTRNRHLFHAPSPLNSSLQFDKQNTKNCPGSNDEIRMCEDAFCKSSSLSEFCKPALTRGDGV